MRKLSSGNKMNFIMFAFIVLVIMVIMLGVLTKGLKNVQEKYQVSKNVCIYDDKYNYINLESDAEISKKWTNNYYLKETDTKKEYKLGNYSVVYNKSKKSLDLFGTFYQVIKGGNVEKIAEHNAINNIQESKFYKIADRKYLIISKVIKNNSETLSTFNYLMVILDKSGNALLLNDDMNVKTINQMIINTDNFKFDVANEKLYFNEEEINLKKIIGSSNEYVEVAKKEEDVAETYEAENNITNEVVQVAENEEKIINKTEIQNNEKTTIIENNNNEENTKIIINDEINNENNPNYVEENISTDNKDQNTTQNISTDNKDQNTTQNTSTDNKDQNTTQNTSVDNKEQNTTQNTSIDNKEQNTTQNTSIDNKDQNTTQNTSIDNKEQNTTQNTSIDNKEQNTTQNTSIDNKEQNTTQNTSTDNKEQNTTQNNTNNNTQTKENEKDKESEEDDRSWVDTLNAWINSVAAGFKSIYNKDQNKKQDSSLTRSINLNSLSSGTSYIDIEYTINDPENKYNVVYVTVSNETETQSISLSKDEKNYRVTGLKPNMDYTVQMGYKIIYSNAEIEESIEDTMNIRTKVPNESLKITKVSRDKIYYTLKLDNNFMYDENCKIVVYLNDEIEYLTIDLNDKILSKAGSSGYLGSFELPEEYKIKGNSLKLVLEDTMVDGVTIDTKLMTKIVNY